MAELEYDRAVQARMTKFKARLLTVDELEGELYVLTTLANAGVYTLRPVA
jgi:hypothetical protein